MPSRSIATAGNLIVAFGFVRSAAATNFTSLVPSDGTNSYTLVPGTGNATSTATFAAVYWAKAVGTGPYVITWTPSANGTVSGQCFEVTGQDSTTPIDNAGQTHGTAVSGTPVSPTSVIFSQSGDLAIGAAHWSGTNATTPLSTQNFNPGLATTNYTPVSATNAHNNSVGLSVGTAGPAGTQQFSFTLGGNVTYACSLVMINGPLAPPPPSTLKNPSIGMIQRGPTAPPASQTAFVHGSIIECHWGAQPSQGDSLTIAAQPDSSQPNVRTVTDAHYSSGSRTLTSATANFTNLDIGALITGPGIPAGEVIAVINSSTSVTMANANTTAPGSGVSVTISGWGQTISPTFINTVNQQLKAVRQYNNNASNVRSASDCSFSASTTIFSTAIANFSLGDIGKYVTGTGLVPGTKISNVTDFQHATIDTPVYASSSGTVQIGQPQTLRLRIECGIHSPTWAFTLGGGDVAVASGSSTGTVPQWWQSPVIAAYANLVAGLASMQLWTGTGPGPTTTCDLTPEIRECLVGLAMLFFGECFIRFPGDGTPTNSVQLLGAGLTSLKDFNTMTQVLSIHGNAFQNTITMADVNPYQNLIGESPAPPASLKGLAFTQGIMDYAITNLNGVSFTNASFDSSTTGNGPLYTVMKNYGPKGTGDPVRNNTAAISFQTYPNPGPPGSGQQYGDLPTLLARAVTYGATSVEIPASAKLPTGFTVGTYGPLDQNIEKDQPNTPANWPWQTTTGTQIQMFVNDQATSSERAILNLLGLQQLRVVDQSLSTEVVVVFSQFLAPYHVSKTGVFGSQQSAAFKPF